MCFFLSSSFSFVTIISCSASFLPRSPSAGPAVGLLDVIAVMSYCQRPRHNLSTMRGVSIRSIVPSHSRCRIVLNYMLRHDGCGSVDVVYENSGFLGNHNESFGKPLFFCDFSPRSFQVSSFSLFSSSFPSHITDNFKNIFHSYIELLYEGVKEVKF